MFEKKGVFQSTNKLIADASINWFITYGGCRCSFLLYWKRWNWFDFKWINNSFHSISRFLSTTYFLINTIWLNWIVCWCFFLLNFHRVSFFSLYLSHYFVYIFFSKKNHLFERCHFLSNLNLFLVKSHKTSHSTDKWILLFVRMLCKNWKISTKNEWNHR